LYSKAGLDKSLLNIIGYNKKKSPLDLKPWNNLVKKINKIRKEISIAVVGKYTNLKDSYKSLSEALVHGGLSNNIKVNIKWINSEKLNNNQILKEIRNVNGILVPGGFGKRGINGKIYSINYARKNKIPFFGICLGMQLAVVEISRNVLKIKDSHSTEFQKTKNPVVGLMTEWFKNNVKINRNEDSDKGGTMRLGSYPCNLKKGSLINKIYNKQKIEERHRHRYEVNINYLSKFEKNGFKYSGMSPDNLLPEIIESKNHPWFIGVQFHPELKSRPLDPHPLFISFVEACINNKK
tara:strand:+ start:124 stop:1005 length:882 start_codon:yes stop_codon:yes gene_type:complete